MIEAIRKYLNNHGMEVFSLICVYFTFAYPMQFSNLVQYRAEKSESLSAELKKTAQLIESQRSSVAVIPIGVKEIHALSSQMNDFVLRTVRGSKPDQADVEFLATQSSLVTFLKNIDNGLLKFDGQPVHLVVKQLELEAFRPDGNTLQAWPIQGRLSLRAARGIPFSPLEEQLITMSEPSMDSFRARGTVDIIDLSGNLTLKILDENKAEAWFAGEKEPMRLIVGETPTTSTEKGNRPLSFEGFALKVKKVDQTHNCIELEIPRDPRFRRFFLHSRAVGDGSVTTSNSQSSGDGCPILRHVAKLPTSSYRISARPGGLRVYTLGWDLWSIVARKREKNVTAQTPWSVP